MSQKACIPLSIYDQENDVNPANLAIISQMIVPLVLGLACIVLPASAVLAIAIFKVNGRIDQLDKAQRMSLMIDLIDGSKANGMSWIS